MDRLLSYLVSNSKPKDAQIFPPFTCRPALLLLAIPVLPGTPLTPRCLALGHSDQQSLPLQLVLSNRRGKNFISYSVAAFQKSQVALTKLSPVNKSTCRESVSGQAQAWEQQEGHKVILAETTSDKAAVGWD